MVRVLTWTLWHTKDDILKKLSTVFWLFWKIQYKLLCWTLFKGYEISWHFQNGQQFKKFFKISSFVFSSQTIWGSIILLKLELEVVWKFWTIFYQDTSKFLNVTGFEGPNSSCSLNEGQAAISRLVWTQRGASLINHCMPQPFPLKATDHCYGASGRLLMGLGCKLIGHRKAQNIQWCSAFIPNWTGPCCRAKRWLISTLKPAWTVNSTVRRLRGGGGGGSSWASETTSFWL